jgi:uracil-DNA glycosylase
VARGTAPSVAGLLRRLQSSPPGAVFNPWWQVDADHDSGPQAPCIRRRQLSAYLAERVGRARLALIGEALGYRGGHFSGIAMTSERLLLGGAADDGIDPRQVLDSLRPRRTSRPPQAPHGVSEPTATIVWRSLLELGLSGRSFVLWNAFAWHPFDPRVGLMSNRMPTDAELAAGLPVLAAFVELFASARIVAVGRLAASQLSRLRLRCEGVRHPASGGAALFRAQIAAIVRSAEVRGG